MADLTALSLCDRCGGSGEDPAPRRSELARGERAKCDPHYSGCGGTGRKTVTLAPEGYAAARIALGDAREREATLWSVYENGGLLLREDYHGWGEAAVAELAALAALRAHPEHGK